MKICFVTYQFNTGGVERVFCALAKELRNYEVLLLPVTPNRDGMVDNIPDNVEFIDLHKKNCFRILNDLKKRLPCFARFFSVIYLLLEVIYVRLSKKFRNTVFINFSDTISTLILSYYGSHIKKVYSWLHFNPKTIYASKFKKFYFYLYRRFYTIICICEEQKLLMSQVIPNLDLSKLTVIYNILDYPQIKQLSEERLSTERAYIVMVARFDKRSKDFQTIIAAYSNLPLEIKKRYKLVFVGDGPDLAEVKESLSDSADREKIIFVGMQKNPYKWIKNASLLVHSSKTEGLPTVLLEALACGTPVISTSCETGPKEILDNGNAGILVNVGDVKAMSDAILTMLENDDLRSSYIKAGKKQLEKFSRNQILNKFDMLWKI